jgi:hypothetical protein
VTNWAEYDAALRQRGSLTIWFSDEAVAAWHAERRMPRGGQPHYSTLAIRTALTLRAVFRLVDPARSQRGKERPHSRSERTSTRPCLKTVLDPIRT